MLWQIKRKTNKYLPFFILMLLVTGCTTNKQQTQAEKFIVQLTNPSTYETASTDDKFLENNFKGYFTEAGYEKFLKDKIQYVYPQLFYMEQTKSVQIVRIEKKSSKKKDKNTVLEYEVKYALKGEMKIQFLEDEVQLMMDKEGKIENFVILNTSDVMHKLVIDMKVY